MIHNDMTWRHGNITAALQRSIRGKTMKFALELTSPYRVYDLAVLISISDAYILTSNCRNAIPNY